MTNTPKISTVKHTWRSGFWLVVLSMLFFIACVLAFWFHPPAEAHEDWEFTSIPWDLWTVMLHTAKEWLFAFGPPAVVGLLQFVIKPCLPIIILRWLAYAWLVLLWGAYSLVLLTFQGLTLLWVLLVFSLLCWFLLLAFKKAAQ